MKNFFFSKFSLTKKKKNLPEKNFIKNYGGRRKKMRLVIRIVVSKSQNQVTKMIETQTECETRSELDNEDDSNADIKSIKKSPLHPRD